MFKPRSINTKIALIFMLITATLIVASSIVLYMIFSRIIQYQITEDLDQVMVQNKLNMDNMISNIDQATMFLYTDKTVVNILSKSGYDISYQELGKDIAAINEQLIKYIYIPLSNNLTSYSLSFFVFDDMPYAKALPPAERIYQGVFNSKLVSTQPWFEDTIKSDGAIYWFTDKKEKNLIYASRLVKNPLAFETISSQNTVKENVGIIVIGFGIAQIGKQIEASKLTPFTQIILTDQNGNILYSKDDKIIGTNIAAYSFAQVLGDYTTENNVMVVYKNQRYIINSHRLSSGWNLIAMVPLADIAQRMSVVKKTIWMTTMVSILSGILLTVLIANSISHPIKQLAYAMKGIKTTAHIDVSLKPPSNDEVGMLYESFNDMMKRINELVSEVYQSGMREKDAELKALQAQINPHFLYNTLDSVNWLALGMGADQIAIMISSLANIMRYSIKNANALVTIADELEQVKNYINIQLIRYDNSFDVEYRIGPEVLPNKTLKLIIQPLVENALLHGIETTHRRGHMIVSGTVSDDKVIIKVEDNGIGADANELNAYLAGKETSLKDSHGYGIKNVDQRIKLHFGNAYGLRYEINDSGGITAIITLPKTIFHPFLSAPA